MQVVLESAGGKSAGVVARLWRSSWWPTAVLPVI